MNPSIVAAAVIALLCGATHAKSFSGFYTPDFVRGERAPFIPVSAGADITLSIRSSGRLLLRETGDYRLAGTINKGLLELQLYDAEGALRGRAWGVPAELSLELQLQLFDSDQQVRSYGVLRLEADAEWLASPVIQANRSMRDRGGRFWQDPDFDDSRWEAVRLPDDNAFGEKTSHSRFYRNRFFVKDPSEALSVVFSSDDGIWIYINGHYLGHWGARENQGGCVNDPLRRCGENGTVPPVPIPAEWLRAGENLLAAKVNNGACCFTYFNLMITRVRARFSVAPQ